MSAINNNIKFLLNLTKTQSIIARRFDGGIGNGLGFNEFLILLHLNESGQKMRRVDLAEKIGMTASGVTRILLPMEKIGLIKNGPVSDDARVRFVVSSASGKQKYEEALERLNLLLEDILSGTKEKDVKKLSDLFIGIGGKILMN